jgi:hypothetical protein
MNHLLNVKAAISHPIRGHGKNNQNAPGISIHCLLRSGLPRPPPTLRSATQGFEGLKNLGMQFAR